MANYKRAFEILTHSFKPQLKNEHFMIQDNEQDKYYLSTDEYICLNDCFNAKLDSIEKIAEEFKELGWKLSNNDNVIAFRGMDFDGLIAIDKINGSLYCSEMILDFKELSLIDRIYDLLFKRGEKNDN